MNNYITGATIRRLREKLGLTQVNLAHKLSVSDKTISKWETGKGLPDISMIEPLANALNISVIELLSGDYVSNANRSCNMKRSKVYVCPVCGNVIRSTGEAVISCCGITLPALEAEEADEHHPIQVDYIDGEYHVVVKHDMSKRHYISFIAYVTDASFEMVKLYPEGNAEARFCMRGRGVVYFYCNQHGLMKVDVQPIRLR